jgi:hypothetical protein
MYTNLNVDPQLMDQAMRVTEPRSTGRGGANPR